jgi:hypothetical protein
LNGSPDDHKSLCYGPKTKTCDDFITILQLLRMRNTFKVAVVEVKSEPVYLRSHDCIFRSPLMKTLDWSVEMLGLDYNSTGLCNHLFNPE